MKTSDFDYELPPEFFAAVLGPRHKYSCCYFPSDSTTLPDAEEAAESADDKAEQHEVGEVAQTQEELTGRHQWPPLPSSTPNTRSMKRSP